MTRVIAQGQLTAPQFAADAYIAAHYAIVGDDDSSYSADPADYWSAHDRAPLGALVRLAHPYRTATGRTVYATRLVKSDATVGDLRRLSRAATALVR